MTPSPHPDPVLPGVSSPRSAARFTTHVAVYDLTASAGSWGPESQPGLFMALEDGKFLVDLGNHLAPARLRESGSIRTVCRPGPGPASGAERPSGHSVLAQHPAGLGLKDRDEGAGRHTGFVLLSLLVG